MLCYFMSKITREIVFLYENSIYSLYTTCITIFKLILQQKFIHLKFMNPISKDVIYLVILRLLKFSKSSDFLSNKYEK